MAAVNRLSEGWIAELLSRLSIADVVRAAGVELTPKGGEFVARCPFHPDNNPSFSVVPLKRMCHCFSGCGTFDAIAFYREIHKVSFLDACKELARTVGLELPVEAGRAALGAGPRDDVGGGERGDGDAPFDEQEVDAAAALGDDPFAAERKAKADAERRIVELKRQESIELARKVWEEAKGPGGDMVVGALPACLDGFGVNHPRAVAYFAARGVPIDRLPGGVLPAMIRYHGQLPRTNEKGENLLMRCPGVVGVFLDDPSTGIVLGVQRIYLDPEGEPKKYASKVQKKTLGTFSRGGCLPLSKRADGGVLVLCEGLETGVALVAMLQDRAAVWSLISSSGGFTNFKLKPEHLAVNGGWVKAIVIAVDLDKSKVDKSGKQRGKAGQIAAAKMAERLKLIYPELPVSLALPSRDVVPEIIDDAGEPATGKSVDWGDVVERATIEAAEAAFWAAATAGVFVAAAPEAEKKLKKSAEVAAEPKAEGQEGDGWFEYSPDDQGRPIMPRQNSLRARWLLQQSFLPRKAAGATWKLQRFAGKWYGYGCVDGGWKWREMSNEQLTAMLMPICEKWVSWAKTDYLPANIKRSTVEEVLAAAIGYVHSPGTSMPMWLPSSFDAVGTPTWRPAISLDVEAVTDELLPKDVVTFPDGLFNAKAWCERRFEMLPLSPRWFSATSMAYRLPQELKSIDVGDDDAVAALAEKLAPTWHRVIREVFNDDPERISTMQEWFGYNCVPDNSYQKIMWLQGFPGTGKGTITHAFRLLLGEDAVAHSDMVALGERFTAAGFVGKYSVIVPEVHTDARTPIAAALNLVKSVSGDDPVSVRDLFMSAIMNVKLVCRWFFTPNDAPNFRDPSNALERRLLVVPTGVPIAKPDPTLKEKLTAEGGAGIFLWSMLGLRRLRERGGFVSPGAGKEMMEEIKRSSNPVLGYAEDRCVRGAGHSVRTSVIYADYVAWAEAQGMDSPLTNATFGKYLKSACVGVHSHAETTNRKRRWYYGGIRPLVDPYDTDESECMNMRLEPAGYGESRHGGTTFGGVEVRVEVPIDQPLPSVASAASEELPF